MTSVFLCFWAFALATLCLQHEVPRNWSAEQAEVLAWIQNALHLARAPRQRGLYISGPPGSGKTQVLLAAIRVHAAQGFRILVACPTGALVASYRTSLGRLANVTVQTLHSSFALLGQSQTYTPPGLRLVHLCHYQDVLTLGYLCSAGRTGHLQNFDLLVFDEISQVSWVLWNRIATAVSEMHASPLVILLGNFQQLQPLQGASLRTALLHEIADGTSAPWFSLMDAMTQLACWGLSSQSGMLLSGLLHPPGLRLKHIALVQHRYGRSTDCTLLEFLLLIRDQVPSQSQLETFFADRCWPGPPDLASTVTLAKTLEDKNKLLCTLLTDYTCSKSPL